jgi:hypothetical protein
MREHEREGIHLGTLEYKVRPAPCLVRCTVRAEQFLLPGAYRGRAQRHSLHDGRGALAAEGQHCRAARAYRADACVVAQGSDTHLLDRLHAAHEAHPDYRRPRFSEPVFTVCHYAGDVTYQVPCQAAPAHPRACAAGAASRSMASWRKTVTGWTTTSASCWSRRGSGGTARFCLRGGLKACRRPSRRPARGLSARWTRCLGVSETARGVARAHRCAQTLAAATRRPRCAPRRRAPCRRASRGSPCKNLARWAACSRSARSAVIRPP